MGANIPGIRRVTKRGVTWVFDDIAGTKAKLVEPTTLPPLDSSPDPPLDQPRTNFGEMCGWLLLPSDVAMHWRPWVRESFPRSDELERWLYSTHRMRISPESLEVARQEIARRRNLGPDEVNLLPADDAVETLIGAKVTPVEIKPVDRDTSGELTDMDEKTGPAAAHQTAARSRIEVYQAVVQYLRSKPKVARLFEFMAPRPGATKQEIEDAVYDGADTSWDTIVSLVRRLCNELAMCTNKKIGPEAKRFRFGWSDVDFTVTNKTPDA